MTLPRLSISSPIAAPSRRGGGSGEPAPHPVPPTVEADNTWLLDSRDVARRLGIGRTKTFQLMASGELPTIRLGRCVRVPAAALQSWILEHTASPDRIQ